jgi:hypothetical protein
MAVELKKDKNILAELFSGNPFHIVNAIEKIKKSGNIAYLPDIFSIYWAGIDPSVKLSISNLITELKTEQGVSYIVDFLEDIDDENDLSYFTGACWQSVLDFSNFIDFFIKLAINGNYETSIEAFSVIENSCLNINDEDRKKKAAILKNSLSSIPDEKKPLIVELIHVIEK